MCSREECEQRQNSNEISVFEATEQTAHKPPTQRLLDCRRAVAKYRRSAAGIDECKRPPPRLLSNLSVSVDYLLEILITQRTASQSFEQPTLLQTVNFVEDRFRAIQVELVMTQQASKVMQRKMARAQILILYLTMGSATYQRKFGQQALTTALTNYWNESVEIDSDDEILSLQILCHINHSLHDQATDGGGLARTILTLYRKHVKKSRHLALFQWTLKLVVTLNLGHWHTVLSMLQDAELPEHFGILARCCLASRLDTIRWKILQAWNYSYRKGEAIAGEEVARLLYVNARFQFDAQSAWDDNGDEPHCMVAGKAALLFGQRAGLPIENESLVFKVAPLQTFSAKRIQRDDSFVFQTNWNVTTADYPDLDQARVDADCVLIPPPCWLRELLSSS